MIRATKRLADRMINKLVPATDAQACADVCVPVIVNGVECCGSPCSSRVVCP